MKLLKNSLTKKVHAVKTGNREYLSECGYNGWPGSDERYDGPSKEITCKKCFKLLSR